MHVKYLYPPFKKLALHVYLECSFLFLFFILTSVSLTIFYKYHNPEFTYLMVKRANQYKSENTPYVFLHDWIDLNKIPELTKEAVLFYEDENFYKHNGYSVKRMKDALIIYRNISNNCIFLLRSG